MFRVHSRSLSDLGIVCCKWAAAARFWEYRSWITASSWPIAGPWTCNHGTNRRRWRRFSLPASRVRPAPDLKVSSADQLRSTLLCLFMLALTGLTGCAQLLPHPPHTTPDTQWSGRLALQMDEQEAQSLSASFELQGSSASGQLVLFSPLGNVLARIQWEPGKAVLVTGNQTRTADSLDVLLQQSTGTQLPVAALFAWLQGVASTADGWSADLSHLKEGRLTAIRRSPLPRATLRIILDR